MKVIDRRIMEPEGRRDYDKYNKEWCEQRGEFCKLQFIDIKGRLQTLDRRLWLLIILLIGNLLKPLFYPEIKKALTFVYNSASAFFV